MTAAEADNDLKGDGNRDFDVYYANAYMKRNDYHASVATDA